VPTTLLAMSDSCIGAKTGINFNSYKNQLGFFYSPMKVHISLKFLETLGENDIISGYGEIFKLSLSGPIDCFKFLSDCLKKRGFHNPDIKDLIYQSLSIKKHVIEIDEYESDLRRILNYGHTFGHSLETFSNYETPHGIAVAWGMDLANWISYKKGFLSKKDFMRIHELAEQFFSFRISKNFIVKDLIEGAKRDKKVSEGKLNLILLEKPGKLRIVPTNFDDNLEKLIAEYLNNYSIIKALILLNDKTIEY
jgi:3-dehydroquinate synthase